MTRKPCTEPGCPRLADRTRCLERTAGFSGLEWLRVDVLVPVRTRCCKTPDREPGENQPHCWRSKVTPHSEAYAHKSQAAADRYYRDVLQYEPQLLKTHHARTYAVAA